MLRQKQSERTKLREQTTQLSFKPMQLVIYMDPLTFAVATYV